jgi:hypothetical protein
MSADVASADLWALRATGDQRILRPPPGTRARGQSTNFATELSTARGTEWKRCVMVINLVDARLAGMGQRAGRDLVDVDHRRVTHPDPGVPRAGGTDAARVVRPASARDARQGRASARSSTPSPGPPP